MSWPLVCFWTAIAVILYTLVVFPAWICLRAKLRPRPVAAADHHPSLSVLLAAYNEQAHIAQRLDNLLASDYPTEKLEIVVASDGSTDATAEIVRGYADRRVRLLELSRGGKGQALNAAAQSANGEVFVFTDANTQFSASTLCALVRPFADASVGGVAGNQVYLRDDAASRTADGETMHWNVDTTFKRWQSLAGNVTSATGAVYAIRADFFQPIPPDAMDDFFVSTGVIARRARLVFAADAVAWEPVATRGSVEFSRKFRVIVQGLRAVGYRRRLLNPLRHGFYAVQLFTHKVLRRLLVVPFLVLLILAPWLWGAGGFYRGFALAEIALLGCALVGGFAGGTRWGGRKLFTLPYFFCLVNAAALAALGCTLLGRRLGRWEPERHRERVAAGEASHG